MVGLSELLAKELRDDETVKFSRDFHGHIVMEVIKDVDLTIANERHMTITFGHNLEHNLVMFDAIADELDLMLRKIRK